MTSAPNITEAKTSLLGPFVSEKGKQGLLDYKYVGQDHSILAPYMYKVWGVFFLLVPKNISPNIVTLVGLSIIGSTTLWANFSSAALGLKCILISIALFLYQTADALDGMQGKRVGMYQNPTTEMFDHGVDSFVTVLTATSMIQFVLGFTSPWQAFFVLFATFVGFHAPTYEHLITSKMIFRGGPTNPTEILIIGQIVFLISGIFPTIFHGHFGHFVALSGAVGATLSLFSSIKELYTFYKGDIQKTLYSTIRGYSPLFVVGIAGALWLVWAPEFYQQHSLLCLLTMAIPWNYAIFRTIINEITAVKNFDTMSVLQGQAPLLLPVIAYWTGIPLFAACVVSFVLAASLYLYTIAISLGEVCDALSMDHFYSIRDERTLNK